MKISNLCENHKSFNSENQNQLKTTTAKMRKNILIYTLILLYYI